MFICSLVCIIGSGASRVPVADCCRQEFSSHVVSEMSLADYIIYWKSHHDNKGCQTNELLYLKDWHFVRYILSVKTSPHLIHLHHFVVQGAWDGECLLSTRGILLGLVE